MKKKKVIILLTAILIIAAAALVYDYVFNSKHRDIASEEAVLKVSSQVLHSDFENDESSATGKYLDKVLEVEGEISAIEDNGLVLNDKIQVEFNATQMQKVVDGAKLLIKGRCVGYDELLEMVKIDQATVINK